MRTETIRSADKIVIWARAHREAGADVRREAATIDARFHARSRAQPRAAGATCLIEADLDS